MSEMSEGNVSFCSPLVQLPGDIHVCKNLEHPQSRMLSFAQDSKTPIQHPVYALLDIQITHAEIFGPQPLPFSCIEYYWEKKTNHSLIAPGVTTYLNFVQTSGLHWHSSLTIRKNWEV